MARHLPKVGQPWVGGTEKEKEQEKMSSPSEPAATGMSRDVVLFLER